MSRSEGRQRVGIEQHKMHSSRIKPVPRASSPEPGAARGLPEAALAPRI
jgi:hypothetical protein